METSEIISTINPLLSTLMETWVKPKLEKKFKSEKNQDEDYLNSEKAIKEFLERSYKKNVFMNTIVFRTQPREIYDLYLPLKIVDNKKEIIIDNYPKDLFEEIKKIIVVDSAGMGKSTLLKWMFVNCILHNKGIPIFIELRRLNKDNTIIDELIKELSSFKYNMTEEVVYDLINQGDFIFFLDGYDEIPLNDKSEVTTDLQDFIGKAHNNIFILSSRDQASLESFVDFYKFQIKPLEKKEAFELIKKYDGNGVLSENLISLIKQDNNYKELEEFLKNPLMISLLYKGFNHKQVIPLKKNLFYRQVYDALFEDHDLTKGGAYVHEKLSGLDSDDFHTVLRSLAFISLKEGTIEYSKDKIIHLLNDSQKQTKIKFAANMFLKDLIYSVPLFYREGSLYRWKHKSLQDYFVAQFICVDSKEHQKNIMTSMYNSREFDRYLNILDLIYDSDFKSFRNTLIIDFLNEADAINDLVEEEEKLNKNQKNLLKNLLFWKRSFIIMDKEYFKKKERNEKIVNSDHSLLFKKARKFNEEHFPAELENHVVNRMSIKSQGNFIIVRGYKWNYKFIDILLKKNFDIFNSKNPSMISNEDLSEFNVVFESDLEFNSILFNMEFVNGIFDFKLKSEIFTDLLWEINEPIRTNIKKVGGKTESLLIDFVKVKKMKKQIESDNLEDSNLETFFSL